MQVSRATEDDLPFIIDAERLPGYERLVGRWDERRHREAMRDGRHAYFLASGGGEKLGFAIVRDWGSPERVCLVKRLAVTRPGNGIGRALLANVSDAVFTETDAHRLWIGVFPENLRARRAYEAVGFVAEGIARGSAFFHGEHRDELVLAMLRSDWKERNRFTGRSG